MQRTPPRLPATTLATLTKLADQLAACRPPLERITDWGRALEHAHTTEPEGALFPIAWSDEDPTDADALVEHYERVLSQSDDELVLFGHYDAYFEGRFTIVTRVRAARPKTKPIEAPPAARRWFITTITTGTTADHRHASQSFYAAGADLAQLAKNNVRLSWNAASVLYATVRRALYSLHVRDAAHGSLTASRIRLRLAREPYTTPSAPLAFVCPDGPRRATSALVREERAIAAHACIQLTEHPDSDIDAALRDPSARSKLAKRLLRAKNAIDPLVRDALAHEHAAIATLEVSTIEPTLLESLTPRAPKKSPLNARTLAPRPREPVDLGPRARMHEALSVETQAPLVRELFALWRAVIARSFNPRPRSESRR